MRTVAVLAREQVYPYPEYNLNLLKRYDDLKQSKAISPSIPLYLNHGGRQIGTAQKLRADDGQRRVLVDLDYNEANIPTALATQLREGQVPISGEFDSEDVMRPGVYNKTDPFDGYQTDIKWTGAALIWNSSQVARCNLPQCGVNVDALTQFNDKLDAFNGVIIKRTWDGRSLIDSHKADEKMETKLKELETQLAAEAAKVATLEKEKQDALQLVETTKQMANHKILLDEVVRTTNQKEDAFKDYCDAGLKGYLAGYKTAKAEAPPPAPEAKPKSKDALPPPPAPLKPDINKNLMEKRADLSFSKSRYQFNVEEEPM